MKPRAPVSIRSLITLIVVLSLLPALALIAYTGYGRFRDSVESMDQDALRAANGVIQRQSRLIESTRTLLLTLSRLDEVRRQDAEAASVLFQNLLLHAPYYENVRLLNPGGGVIAAGKPETAALPPRERERFLLEKNTLAGFAVTTLRQGEGRSAPLIICLFPVMEGGKLRSVLEATTAFSVTPAEISRLAAERVEKIHIVDSDGGVLFAYPDWTCGGTVICEHLADAWGTVRSAAADHGFFRDTSGRHIVFERLRSPDRNHPDFIMLLSVSLDTLVRQAHAQIFRYLIGLAVILGVALLLATYLCNAGFLNPLRVILRCSRRVKDGDLSARIGDEPMPEELRLLADALNSMTWSLQTRDSELTAARDAANAANQAKTDFLATMSHEIRTPMNAILGMTYLALQGDLTEEQRRLLNAIREESATLQTLLNEVLDFSKVQSGALQSEAVPFDLRSALHDVIAQATAEARKKGIGFSSWTAPDLPQFLRGDPVHFSQALGSIVHNAIKITERGEVGFACSAERGASAPLVLVCRITDTAGGLSDKETAEFFPEQEPPDPIAPLEGSVGLSLSVARALVRLMRGTISVGTEPGVGSAVTLRLPFHEVAPAHAREGAQQAERTDAQETDAGQIDPAAP